MSIEGQIDNDRIVRHIMVIGFHHKHGYQVDYCYPPLVPDGPVFSTSACPISLPTCWKTLPLLCLPDGSHNYDSDTIYFTMPDNSAKTDSRKLHEKETQEDTREKISEDGIKTIFGTACYRQIQSDKLLNRTDDMTRLAVQKSVCILSTKPLFGVIRSKLEMITHAYFEELDFSKVGILRMTYDNLNSLLSRKSVVENAAFLGLSARELISQFGSNSLLLFKAILLEKKILFYKSPVRDLCSTIMSMCSIFTGLLENGGLDYSTCDLNLSAHLLEALKLSPPSEESQTESTREPEREDKVYFSQKNDEVIIVSDSFRSESRDNSNALADLSHDDVGGPDSASTDETSKLQSPPKDTNEDPMTISDDASDDGMDNSFNDESCVEDPYASKLCRMKPEDCGLPLQVFTRGSFCLPYLSISYLDLLGDTRVRSFVIGATNFLFKQRKEMYDVIVDMEENSITINDAGVRRALNLTTEDLRFMDYICRNVKLESSLPKSEFDLSGNDIAKWVGGDEWIRFQFRLYTIYLLKASKGPSTSAEPFNPFFMKSWKQTTNNYRIWDSAGKFELVDRLQARHPFSSAGRGINFSDMRLKLSYAVQSSEKGRMINQTLNDIGKWSIWNNLASAGASASSSISSALISHSSDRQAHSSSRSKREDDPSAEEKIKDI